MKHRFLHVIEKANLVGLADDNDMEVVECIYDHIHPLVCGKFIVVKDVSVSAMLVDTRQKKYRSSFYS